MEKKYGIVFVLIFCALPPRNVQAQFCVSNAPSVPKDSLNLNAQIANPNVVHWWLPASVILAGGAGSLWWLMYPQSPITDSELASMDPNNVPGFDRFSLHQDIALVHQWNLYAHIGQVLGGAMPLFLLFDPAIRRNALDIMAYALETSMAELGFYALLPLGPRWITRYRPLVYYTDASEYGIDRNEGYNKASFYSGHVASVAASAFFMARVYSDYHPMASKTLLYGGAAIPTLAMSLIRFMTLDHFPSDILVGTLIGAAFGLIIPQTHRIPP